MSDYIAATTHIDTSKNVLVFDSEGYYVVGDGKWEDIIFTTTLTYKGGNIGIAPRIYDTNFYMFLSIHNENSDETGNTKVGFASLDAQVTYNTYNIAQARLAPLVVNQNYTFKVEIKSTYYKISLNDTVIFNVAYPGMPHGSVGVYATAGNECSSIEVQSDFPDVWETNVDSLSGAIVDIQDFENEDKYMYLSNPTPAELFAQQEFTVDPDTDYTLSFNANGNGTVKIIEMEGAAPNIYNYIVMNGDWSRESFTETISSDCTRVRVSFCVTNQDMMVNDIQFEDKPFDTAYIHNDSTTDAKVREQSIITYPSKDNIRKDKGSVSMWFKPSKDYVTGANVTMLFEYGASSNRLMVYYNNGYMRFKYGVANSIGYRIDLSRDTWYNVTATWTESKIQLYVDGHKVESSGTFALIGDSDLIRIGHSASPSYDMFNGAIDETIVYSSILTADEVNASLTAEDPVADGDSMIMRATFNYAIANFNKSIIEAALIPNYGSPVLVEKSDGTAMRKVSFFDYFTGEYRTFNEEMIEYDMDYDYIELSYYDRDVDQQTFKINVVDENNVTWGRDYTLKGKKLYLNLEEDDKVDLDGTLLYVTYQLEDSYTVDFNIDVPDAFRVTLGKHDGQPVKVTYEGNRFTDEKLITMVEMNPLLSPNHEGFLYITRNDEKVSAFRTMATPTDLPANGGAEALIVVEPLDVNGNFVSHCKLNVSCEEGIIIPAYDEESIKLRDRAGRFLYRYNAPVITFDNSKAYEITDYVNVIDEETGIGVQIPIILTTLREEDHVIGQGDTLESIAEHYGSTIGDIAYANGNKSLADMRTWVTSNVGSQVQVPINYSKKEMERATLEVKHDSMIAYLTNMVIDYMNKPVTQLPAGLDVLDFNDDGMINIGEITWLRENRLTTTLETQYNAVRAWDTAN